MAATRARPPNIPGHGPGLYPGRGCPGIEGYLPLILLEDFLDNPELLHCCLAGGTGVRDELGSSLKKGLVAAYLFQTLGLDDTGKQALLTNLGSVTQVAGTGIDSGTAGSYSVTLPNLVGVSLGLPVFSVAAWFNPAFTNGTRIIAGDFTAAGSHGWKIEISTGLKGWVNGVTATLGSVLQNTWYHAAITYDGAVLRTFFNGVPTGIVTQAIDYSGPGPLFFIGNTFQGEIAGVYIANRVWSAQEVANLYTYGLNGIAYPWLGQP